MFRKLQENKDEKRLMVMHSDLHADVYERDHSVVPSEQIVFNILQEAEGYQADNQDGLTLVPYEMKAMANMPSMAMTLGWALKKRQICLAYSEDPQLIYVNFSQLSKLPRTGLVDDSWSELVDLVWYSGFRLAKLIFTSVDVEIITYERNDY